MPKRKQDQVIRTDDHTAAESSDHMSTHDVKEYGAVPVLKVGPSDAKRPGRVAKRQVSEIERQKRALNDAGAPFDQPIAVDQAAKSIAEREACRDTASNKKWRARVQTAPVGQQPADENPIVMLAALMRQPEVVEFTEKACERSTNRGRPTTSRLHVAILLSALLCGWVTSLRQAWAQLAVTDLALHRALRFPLDGVCGRSLNSAYEGISRIYPRVDPAIWRHGAIYTHQELGPLLGPDAMLLTAVDGTRIRPNIENRKGSCPEEAALIDRGMRTRAMSYGPGDFCRGYLVTIISPTKSCAPLAWSVGMEGDPIEDGAVPGLLADLYARWPTADIEFMVGDSKYDTTDLSRHLLFGYAINPVFVRHGGRGVPVELNEHGWRDGVLHGPDGKPVRYIEADGFPTPQMRRDAGLAPGVEVEAINGKRPRIRLEKPGPPTTTGKVPRMSVYPWHHPRFHTLLPFAPSHPDRYAARIEMLAARNVAEAANAQAQFDGLALASRVARFINSPQAAEHLIGIVCWAVGRRKLLRLNGEYERVEHEFRREGLLSEAIVGRDSVHEQLALPM